MSDLISLAAVYAARARIEGVAVCTPLLRLEPERLRAAGLPVPECAVYLKAESAQPIDRSSCEARTTWPRSCLRRSGGGG